MECRMCGFQFDEEEVGRSCQGCGKKECEKVHCPKCGYGNSMDFETEFKVIDTLKKKLGIKKDKQ